MCETEVPWRSPKSGSYQGRRHRNRAGRNGFSSNPWQRQRDHGARLRMLATPSRVVFVGQRWLVLQVEIRAIIEGSVVLTSGDKVTADGGWGRQWQWHFSEAVIYNGIACQRIIPLQRKASKKSRCRCLPRPPSAATLSPEVRTTDPLTIALHSTRSTTHRSLTATTRRGVAGIRSRVPWSRRFHHGGRRGLSPRSSSVFGLFQLPDSGEIHGTSATHTMTTPSFPQPFPCRRPLLLLTSGERHGTRRRVLYKNAKMSTDIRFRFT